MPKQQWLHASLAPLHHWIVYCLLFVSANLRVISTLFVGVICGSNKDAGISLIRSSMDQADLEACSSLCSNCRGRPWKQSTLPHPWWRWRYSYTGGRRIALFGQKSKWQLQEMCSFMQRQVEVSLQIQVAAVFRGRLPSPVRSLLMECCGAKEVPERLTRSGTLMLQVSIPVTNVTNVFQHISTWASPQVGCFLLASPTDVARTKLVETLGFVIRQFAGSVGQKNIQAGFVILCSSVIHAFRRNAFTDVSLLMSLM